MTYIYTYTTEQAIEDGSLIDASDLLIMPNKGEFQLGRLVITAGIHGYIELNNQTPYSIKDSKNGNSIIFEKYEDYLSCCLFRHAIGDWGNIPKADIPINERAITMGSRIMSSYYIDPSLPLRGDIWIITEADRSVTTFLLPSEY